MSETLQANTEGWLRKLGATPVALEDATADWHFQIDYPARTPHQIHVVGPKGQEGAVVIASATAVSPEHLKAFEELDDDSKSSFLWELRSTLVAPYTEFILEGVTGELVCPTRFQITTTRWEDGLSMDSFARSVSSVYKTELAGIMVIQRHLGGRGFGSPGRFDFKRIGM